MKIRILESANYDIRDGYWFYEESRLLVKLSPMAFTLKLQILCNFKRSCHNTYHTQMSYPIYEVIQKRWKNGFLHQLKLI